MNVISMGLDKLVHRRSGARKLLLGFIELHAGGRARVARLDARSSEEMNRSLRKFKGLGIFIPANCGLRA
jgi:hypothetical protein